VCGGNEFVWLNVIDRVAVMGNGKREIKRIVLKLSLGRKIKEL